MPSAFAHVDGEDFYLIFLYHPFSRRQIQLSLIPQYVPQPVCNYSLHRLAKIVLSCSPPHPACVAAYYSHPNEGIRFCNVAAKSEARREMNPCNKTYCQDIAFYNGSIYVTPDDGALSVADTTSSQITRLLPAPLASGIPAFPERHVPSALTLFISPELRHAADALGFGTAFFFSAVFGIRLAATHMFFTSGALVGLSIFSLLVFVSAYLQERV